MADAIAQIASYVSIIQEKGSSKCRKKSAVYETKCQICVSNGSNEGVYVGETSRSLYERSLEHLEDAEKHKSGSHIFKHWALAHGNELAHKISYNMFR